MYIAKSTAYKMEASRVKNFACFFVGENDVLTIRGRYVPRYVDDTVIVYVYIYFVVEVVM